MITASHILFFIGMILAMPLLMGLQRILQYGHSYIVRLDDPNTLAAQILLPGVFFVLAFLTRKKPPGAGK